MTAPAVRPYLDEEWEHGLRCAQCSRLFTTGMPVCERLESIDEDGLAVVLIVCADCDLQGEEER